MEVTIQRIERTEIHLDFVQDFEEHVDDITPLYTSLKKIKKIITAPGFKNPFNKGEKEMWGRIFSEILKEEEKTEGLSSSGSGLTQIEQGHNESSRNKADS